MQHADAEDQRSCGSRRRSAGPSARRAVRRCWMAQIAAEHEAAQRHDRQRHVHVEDLLHEALVGVHRARRRRPARSPPVSVTAVASDRARRRFPYSKVAIQSSSEEVEHRVGEQPEHQIIERQDRQPAPRERLGAARPAKSGAVAGAPAMTTGMQQRQREQRARSGRARGSGPRARRPACRRPRGRGRRAAGRATSAPAAPASGDGPSSSSANAGTATSSSATRKTNSASALATSSAVRSTGASRKPSKPPCSRSATNRRLMPSIAANSSVTHSTPAARSPSTVLALQREVEDDERRDAEQRHRRHRLAACAARAAAPCAAARRPCASPVQRPDLARRRRSRPAPSRSARPARRPSARSASASPPAGSWLVTTRVRPLAAPISGSTQLGRRRVEVGARLVEQQQLGVVQHRAARPPARWTIPRERCATGSSARARQPDAARAARRRALGATPCRRAWKRRFSRPLRSR